jgi:hypothetical protein
MASPPANEALPSLLTGSAGFGINVRDLPFGAVGDGQADDTVAIQRALDAAVAAGGDSVLIPRGTYRIRETLRIADVVGLRVRGAGAGATTLRWDGDDVDPLLHIADAYSSTVQDLFIRSTSDAPLHTAILVDNGPGVLVPPSRTTLESLVIDGTNAGGLGIGVRFALGAGGDNNNDFHLLEKVSVNNYGEAGFSLEGSQAKALLFLDCVASGNGLGRDGVATHRGEGARGGSFTWIGGGGGGNLHADFHLGDASAPISILGASFESSAMLLDTEGPTNAPWPVTLRGTRWSVDASVTALESHGAFLRFRSPGPLRIEGCTLSVFDPTAAGGVGSARIDVASLGADVALTFVDNAVTVDVADAADLFRGSRPTLSGSNLLRTRLDEPVRSF